MQRDTRGIRILLKNYCTCRAIRTSLAQRNVELCAPVVDTADKFQLSLFRETQRLATLSPVVKGETAPTGAESVQYPVDW